MNLLNGKLIGNSGITIVVFTAKWCSPCFELIKYVNFWLPNIKSLTNSNVSILEIDIDEYPIFVSYYQLRSIPTSIYFYNEVQIGETITGDGSNVVSKLEEYVRKYV